MKNIKGCIGHYSVIIFLVIINLLWITLDSGYCGTCEIKYTDPITYSVTHEAVITFRNAGGNNNRLKMQFVFPAPRSWPEMEGAYDQNMTIYPNNWRPGVGHYQAGDTDYLYYWFEDSYWNMPKKMKYTYSVRSKNTILRGELDTTFEALRAYVDKNGQFRKYLRPSNHIEIDSKILKIRGEIFSRRGKPKDNDVVLETVKDFYNYIYDHARYNDTKHYKFEGTKDFKHSLYGQCGEYSALLIALCRSIGVPSRPVVGAWVGSKKNQYHVWSEHFFPYVGWVPIDVTMDQSNGTRYKNLGNLKNGNRRIVLSKNYDVYISQVKSGYNYLPLLQVVNWWWWYSNGNPEQKPSVKSNIWGDRIN